MTQHQKLGCFQFRSSQCTRIERLFRLTLAK
jgi:hypothetical protein